jgi:hypothetical protein
MNVQFEFDVLECKLSKNLNFEELYFDMTPESRNSPPLDNGSVSTFPRHRIDTVTDEMFEIIVSSQFASKLQEESSVQESSILPCGGRVEYLHRSPANRRRRQKGKSRI